MPDFEKVSGGSLPEIGPVRRAIKYRNKAGVEHVVDMIENAKINKESLGRIRDIKGYLDNVGEILEKDEMSLADVSGGASLEAINDRRFDSIWKQKDPRKILRLFKNTDGSINLEAAAAAANKASVIKEIMNEMSVPGKERLLLAGILLTDDGFNIEDLIIDQEK